MRLSDARNGSHIVAPGSRREAHFGSSDGKCRVRYVCFRRALSGVTPGEQRAESRHENKRSTHSKNHVSACIRGRNHRRERFNIGQSAFRIRETALQKHPRQRRRARTIFRALREQSMNCQRERSRNVLTQTRQRRRGSSCLLNEQRRLQRIDERRPTREHFIQQNTETVEIAARADALAQTLFRRHVTRRSDNPPRAGARVCRRGFSRRSQDFRNSEIEHTNTTFAEQYVGRLEIARKYSDPVTLSA